MNAKEINIQLENISSTLVTFLAYFQNVFKQKITEHIFFNLSYRCLLFNNLLILLFSV